MFTNYKRIAVCLSSGKFAFWWGCFASVPNECYVYRYKGKKGQHVRKSDAPLFFRCYCKFLHIATLQYTLFLLLRTKKARWNKQEATEKKNAFVLRE